MAGHREGVNTVRKITRLCGELGVEVLTLYTFSSENWHRPQTEVTALMKLFVQSLRSEIKELMKNDVRFTMIGDRSKLPKDVLSELNQGIECTRNNKGLNLNLAFSYGSRQEITQAIVRIAADSAAGKIQPSDIDEHLVSRYLYTSGLPDPDLLVRTGGEFRISNFLLWQIAYSELYITSTYWPDFDDSALFAAIAEYQSRERRYGQTSNQIRDHAR